MSMDEAWPAQYDWWYAEQWKWTSAQNFHSIKTIWAHNYIPYDIISHHLYYVYISNIGF